jgi:hypothetical protein
MADSWLTYTDYLAYGYADIAEAEFPRFAAQATLQIMEATHWRASIAADPVSLKHLQDCEALLICEAAKQALVEESSGSGAVTSSSNDGYSESYAAASDTRKEYVTRCAQIIRQTLGAPGANWMLLAGAVYHPRARR